MKLASRPLVILCQFIALSLQAQQHITDSLLSLLRTDREDTNKVIHLTKLSWQYKSKGSYDTALQYAQRGLDLAITLNFKKGISDAYNNFGNVYDKQGNYPLALKNYKASLELSEQIGDQNGIATSYNNIGIIHSNLGNYPEALRNYFASLKIKEKLGNKKSIGNSYSNIGNVYAFMGNYAEGLKYHFIALKYRQEAGSKKGIANSYSNIGNIYFYQGNFAEGLKNLYASLEINKDLSEKQSIGMVYGSVGGIHAAQADHRAALADFTQALKIFEEIGDQQSAGATYSNIGIEHIHLGNPPLGKEWLQKGLRRALDIHSVIDIKSAYGGLVRADSVLGNYKGALDNYKLFVLYRDSLVNEENTKKTVQTEMQYEFDKKEEATRLDQEKKDALASAEKKRQSIILYAISGFGLLILGFAVFAYRSYLQKQKANVEIMKQKEVIEEKQKEILDSIHYAQRIQKSLLTQEHYIMKHLSRLHKT